MLTTLAVENITVGKHTDVPNLGRVNLIVGKNGSGKSALLDAIMHDTTQDAMVPCILWDRLLNPPAPSPGEQRIQELIDVVRDARGGIVLVDGVDDGIHYSMMDEMWEQLFSVAVISNVQIFATTHSRDCVEGFSKVASAHKDIGGVLFRLGKSAKASNKGEIIATRFDADELRAAIESGIEVR